MKKFFIIFLIAMAAAFGAFAQKISDNLVLVKGGAFKDEKCTNFYGRHITLPNFYIGKYEVTQKEWTDVMGSNPSQFKGDKLPVETVSWYECVDYCNARSAKEGLQAFYNIDKNAKDTNNQTAVDGIKWTVTTNPRANGYRLPTEAEWEYAASGGQLSRNFKYSGGDEIEKVALFWQNSGDTNLTGFWTWPRVQANNDRTHAVGSKEPNELGLYDMSGNVREWCWEWFGELDANGNGPKSSTEETGRVWKGGGWMGGDFCCELEFRASFEASGKGPDQGLRVCRSE